MSGNTDHILYHRIESKVNGPSFLILSGVHGDEYEPMLAGRELIERLPAILTSGVVTIVPIVNMSAYSEGSRYGADGRDLARTCPGKDNGTVTERAAAQVTALIRESDYCIDMHTGGALFDIYPLAGYMLHESREVLENQRKMARAFGLPVIWGTDNEPEGRTLSIARDADVPAIYVESGGGGGIRPDVADTYVRGCINVLALLNMVKEVPTTMNTLQKPLRWVEDPLPGSGYLQGKMPAPLTGLFVPVVTAGESVARAQTWGSLVEMPSGRKIEIKAESEGMALFVRSAGFVTVGEALGGILSSDYEVDLSL